jgi:TRAP-type C4-dicarboxylate transport system substrate-binding protein
MIERRKLLKIGASGIAASVAMPFVGRTGWAATPTHTLKLTFADTQNHPLYEVLKRFAEDVSKRTSGAIEIQVFSIGQLGSGTNILTGLQTGIIDFCAHTSGFVDTIYPKFQVVDLPFLFSDAASAERLLDGPTGTKLLDMLPAKGIYGLGYGHWGWRVVSTIDRKAPEPEGMKGLKIRVQPGAIFASTFKALGASPVAIDLTEVYWRCRSASSTPSRPR